MTSAHLLRLKLNAGPREHELLGDRSALEWLESLQSPNQPWMLFVTVTMHRFDAETGRAWSVQEIDKAIVKFLWRVEGLAFKKASRYGSRRLGRIVVRHLGHFRVNPHFHVIVTFPIDRKAEELRELISKASERIRWVKDRPHVENYRSAGAISYLMSDPAAELVLEALARAN